MNELTTINPMTGEIARRPAGGNALAASDQQRAIAEVQARMMIARMNPRDVVAATDRIINACSRKTLADAAVYTYARGGQDVSGPSIRLAETIGQHWSNIEFGFRELSRGIDADGVGYSEVEAYAWDIEMNTRRPVMFRVRHWRDTKKGGYPIKDERDIYELTANMAQRRVRACILAIIPGDVVEAAVDQCELTMKANADTSPEAMHKMLTAFEQFGVTREQIEKRIQRRLDAIQPAQVVGLKKIYASLRDGITNAVDWFDVAEEQAAKSSLAEIKAAAAKQQTKPAATAATPSGGPSITEIEKEMKSAKTLDALNDAADLIGSIGDAGQRAALGDQYVARKTELNKGVQ